MMVFSHPLGNANSKQAALALWERRLLAECWTCVHWNEGSTVERLLPRTWRSELQRRSFPAVLRPVLRTWPRRELPRLALSRLGVSWGQRHEHGFFSVDAVFRSLDNRVAGRLPGLPEVRGVFATEDGALRTFESARNLGKKRFYDLPIAYWRTGRAILQEEAERMPEWRSTLPAMEDSREKLERKDRELALADVVIVASRFSKESLRGASLGGAVEVVGYGAPPVAAAPFAAHPGSGPLRVLFVGSLSQRKGLSYMLKAVEEMGGEVALTMIGRPVGRGCRPLQEALDRHRWIPSLPHGRILDEMRRHDVLLFPSLFEGYGLVITEAMSQGLPVITTPHTAGPDVITDGVDGFIVPVRDTEAIVRCLKELKTRPDLLASMREKTRIRASALRWEDYRRKLAGIVLTALSQ